MVTRVKDRGILRISVPFKIRSRAEVVLVKNLGAPTRYLALDRKMGFL